MKVSDSGNDVEKKTLRKGHWFLIAAILVAIVAAGSIAVYLERIAPFRTTVISVGDATISMRTFIKRTNLSGQEPMAMLQALAEEEIIKQVAPYPPYSIQVTDEDVVQYLHNVAQGDSDPLSDDAYKQWYRQQLNESMLSDSEFTDLVRTRMLMQGLHDYLAARVPTVAEQVHLFMIPVEGFSTAERLRERLLNGEKFDQIARNMSVDSILKETGGDVGWFSRSSLLPHIARAAFDELELGEISMPLFLDEGVYAIVKVTERAAARKLDEVMLRGIQNDALKEWLIAEQNNHTIGFFGFSGAYDSETEVWVRWQVARMKKQVDQR